MLFRSIVTVACIVSATPGPAAADVAPDPLTPARELLAHGDTTAAVHWLDRARRGAADSAADILLGRIYRERGTINGRLRSQRVLEAARTRFPDDVELRLELGLTYFAQGFFPDAVACFNAVLARAPDRCDARYMLGLYHFQSWKRMNQYRDDLERARHDLAAVLDCDTSNADAAARYLVVRYALGDPPVAECARMIARFPHRPEFWMFHGVFAYEDGRFDDCASDFARGLSLLDDEARRTYRYLGRVLPAAEKTRLDALPADERETSGRAFWIRGDPDPTTPINERELEHVYRMFVADALYSNRPTRKRGWETDRGEAFVKFGAPTSVMHTLGDDNRTGRTEVWLYAGAGSYRTLVFVDEFLNGNLRIPYAADWMLHFMRHAPRLSAVTPSTLAVPAILDVVAFRDGGMAASVYVAMRVDADSLRRAADLSRVNRFVVRGAWFDGSWRRAGAFADSVWTSETPTRLVDGSSGYEIVRRVDLPFDDFRFACAFEDSRGQARAIVRGEAAAARFLGDGLAVSDILLIGEDGAPENVVERHGQTMWPRIRRAYRPGEMLRVYLEIYNLSRVARATEYDVRFAIFPSDTDPVSAWREWGRRVGDLLGLAAADPVIAQTFRRAGVSNDERESIGIDIATLGPGDYTLLIEVRDDHSGQRTITHTGFRKEPDHAGGGKR